MANICCDDVYFFSDDNTEGIEALWKDLQASITPGYKDDLGQIERLFLHAGLSTEGINLRGTVVAMERTDHAVQLSLDTAWRPLHAIVHGDWMEWQIAELEIPVPNGQPASQA